MTTITDNTPLAALTVGQFRELFGVVVAAPAARATAPAVTQREPKTEYVYGIAGIAKLFDCSKTWASELKRSGKIDGAITQVGRKIIVNANLALELASRKTGERKSNNR